jgi:hypothetical protein
MKAYTNKSKKKSSASSGKVATKETGEKPRYSVEEISNGFILEKSWYDGQKYHCIKKYHEKNPLEDESEED